MKTPDSKLAAMKPLSLAMLLFVLVAACERSPLEPVPPLEVNITTAPVVVTTRSTALGTVYDCTTLVRRTAVGGGAGATATWDELVIEFRDLQGQLRHVRAIPDVMTLRSGETHEFRYDEIGVPERVDLSLSITYRVDGTTTAVATSAPFRCG